MSADQPQHWSQNDQTCLCDWLTNEDLNWQSKFAKNPPLKKYLKAYYPPPSVACTGTYATQQHKVNKWVPERLFLPIFQRNLSRISLGRWKNHKVWQWSDESVFALFKTDDCQTIVRWYRLYEPVGLNHDVILLRLLRCWFSRLAFIQNSGQLSPEYTKLSPPRLMDFFARWKRQDSLDSNCAREVYKEWSIIFTHGFQFSRPQPHPRSLIPTGKKSFGEEKKNNHCKWLLGLKDVQQNVAFCGVLCF